MPLLNQNKLSTSDIDDSPSDTGNLEELKHKFVRGSLVTIPSHGILVAIRLASTVVLARLLSPEDYGVIAMVMAVTAFAELFRELGLSSAAIQKKNLTHAQQSNLFWLNVAMGTLLTVLVAAASPLVAWFYQNPELRWITVALSLSFLVASLGTQHGAYLVREMQFGRQAVAMITGLLISLAVTIICALLGLAYWALVWGNLAGGITTTVLLSLLSSFRPSWFRQGSGIRDMLKFGGDVTLFGIVQYFGTNLDKILLGKFIGIVALGIYSKANQLMLLPVSAIRNPILTVAYPAMSQLRGDSRGYRSYAHRITFLMAFLSMPLAAFIGVASGPIIHIALGPEWKEVASVVSWLALAFFISPTASLRGNVMLSSGHSRRYVLWGLISSGCATAGYLIGIRWGLFGIAMSVSIVAYILLYPSLVLSFRDTPLRPSDFFKSISLPVTASLVAILITLWINGFAAINNLGEVSQLAILGVAFFSSYLLTTLASSEGRHQIRDGFKSIKLALRPQ